MDLQQAQQAYDLALQEYQDSLNKPSLFADNMGNVKTESGLRQTPLGMQGYDGINGIGGLKIYSPVSGMGGGVADRGGLDAARKALEAAQSEQRNKLGTQYDRLTGQASNALYGGILGYNPSAMQSPTGRMFQAPQGNFRNQFANMQGILGSQPSPVMGGMGQMMQPKFNMGG
jgi:hypothetical protein